MIKVKLNTARTPGDAYMLRRDGEEIWVDVHPYGAFQEMKTTRECNLLAAVFLARYNVEGLCDMVANVGSNLAVSDPRPKMFTVSLSADEKEIYVTGSLSKNFTVWDQEGTKALANVQNKAKTTFFISKYDRRTFIFC